MIHTLGSDAFAGVLSPPSATGISPLFRAKIRVDGNSLRCYVKPLPDMIDCPMRLSSVPNHEVISEALGYVLAKSCGFSVPDVAGIILLDQEQIPVPALNELQRLGKGQLQENYFCWFSRDMIYPNLTQKYMLETQVQFLQQRRIKRFVDELINEPDTTKVIALDDWLINSDRHPGNLLAAGNSSLMLIDHGRILVYPNWEPGGIGSLGPSRQASNRLKDIIDSQHPAWSSMLPKKSQMLMAYNSFAVSFRGGGELAAREVLARFFDSPAVDSVINLLNSRHDPAAYAKASGMVL